VSLIERSGTRIVVEIDCKTYDAPYCDTFLCKECWVITGSDIEAHERSILTQFIKVEMLKYTIFKSKIIYKGEEGVGLTLKAWNE
jgi:hypothetical protein